MSSTIDLGDIPLSGSITLEVTDVLGRGGIQYQVQATQIEVDLGKEVPGVYVIRIRTEAGAQSLRVVK